MQSHTMPLSYSLEDVPHGNGNIIPCYKHQISSPDRFINSSVPMRDSPEQLSKSWANQITSKPNSSEGRQSSLVWPPIKHRAAPGA